MAPPSLLSVTMGAVQKPRSVDARAFRQLERGLDRHPGGRWEQAFRDHLRRVVACGELAAEVVALGPWWRADGQDEIDALAGEARAPVLVGEAKWIRAVDGSRLLRILQYKAAADDVERMVYVVGAREHVVNLPPGVVGITAEEVFAA